MMDLISMLTDFGNKFFGFLYYYDEAWFRHDRMEYLCVVGCFDLSRTAPPAKPPISATPPPGAIQPPPSPAPTARPLSPAFPPSASHGDPSSSLVPSSLAGDRGSRQSKLQAGMIAGIYSSSTGCTDGPLVTLLFQTQE